MTHKEALVYLDSFINYEKERSLYKANFKLQRINNFLGAIGNPQDKLKFIHIAGTKGKGSVSVFTAYIFKETGFKVGLYTSPHLTSFRERIRLLNPKLKSNSSFEGAISKKEVCSLVIRLKPFIDRFNQESHLGKLTFFEVYTSLAFVYFREKKADWVVLETGLGGQFDATNAIKESIACITPISYEHTNILGKTLPKITKDKLGIVKQKGSILITAPQEKKAYKEIIKKTGQLNLRLTRLSLSQIKPKSASLKSQTFDLKTEKDYYPNLAITLLGKHQLINASLAVLIAERLGIKKHAIYRGLKEALWPARFEILNFNPFIIADGAQNAASFQALNDTLKDNFSGYKKTLILGLSSDKDIKRISKELTLFDNLILTKSNNPRAMSVSFMKRFIKRKVLLTNNINDALKVSRNLAEKSGLIVISGSLFLAAQARQLLFKECLTD